MKSRDGFTLVEVTLALGVAGFCLLAVFGLLPIGINLNRAAAEQSAAVNAAAALIADARATPSGQTSSTRYGIPLPAAVTTGPAQVRQIALYLTETGEKVASASARYLVMVTLTGPPANYADATQMHVLVTWPAQANASFSTTATTDAADARAGLKNLAGSAETVAAFNRN